MSSFLKIAGTTAVLVIATVLIGPSFINWNRYKSAITEPVQKLIGRKLEIAGDVSFSLLPSPAFSAQGLQIENIDGGEAPAFVGIRSLEINVALLPLLGGRVNVTSITLNEPTVALEILSDGRRNWTFARAGQKEAAPDPDARTDGAAPVDISFSEVMIKGGAVSFHDAISGDVYRLGEIDATVSASSLDGPFTAKGAAVFRQTPVSFKVLVGNLKRGRAVPVSFALGLDDVGAKIAFAGWASEAAMDARLNGRLTLEGENLAAAVEETARAVGFDAAPTVNRLKPLGSAFSGEAQVVTSPHELRVRNISLSLGDSIATGAFQATFETEKRFEGNLDVASIDLDGWIDATGPENNGAEALEAGATSDGPAAPWSASAFELPKDLSGTLDISVGAVNYHGGVARQLGISLRLGDGRLGIENVSALLPGGSAAELAGVLAQEQGAPRFSGRLKVSSDNLRSLLSWLNVEVDAVPVDRLTRLSYSSALDVTSEAVQVYGMDLSLDTVRATGGVSVALRKRLAFGVDFTIDSLNLDTYLGAPADRSDDEKPDAQSAAGSTSALNELKQSLAGLEDLDANVKLKIGHLNWRGKDVEKLSLDVRLFGGELTVKDVSFDNYQGLKGTLAGSAAGFSRKPEADFSFDFQLREPSALARIVGNELPYPASRLGAGRGVLKFRGNEDRVTVGLDAVFAGTRLEVDGGVIAPTVSPALDLTVTLRNPSVANLVKQFDLPLHRPQGKDDGPVTLSLSTTGKVADLKVRSVAEVGGGKLTADGRIENVFTGPEYRIDAGLRGDDLRKFVRGLGVDFRPAARNLGALHIAFTVQGDAAQASLSGFKGQVGPVQFSGTATARFSGDRPRIDGVLKTSEVIVDLFLPPSSTGLKASGGGGTARPAQRWSREKIDLSFLRDFAGEVRIESPGVVVGAYDFRDLRAVLTVDDGVAILKPLTARLFGGDAELSLRLDGRKVPALDLQLALTNADVAKAMTAAAGIDTMTGRAGFNGEFQSTGRSQFDLIAALRGGARISAREGVIRGIDLRRLSDRLGAIKKIPDVLKVVSGSLSGGQTAYRSIEGSFQVEKGVARTTDVRADIDAVDATITSEMDLVNWTMNTSARFRLTDHPKAPPVGIDLRGPIDDPVRDLKTRKLEGYLTKLIGTAVLNKLIGSKASAPQAEGVSPSPTGDPASPPPTGEPVSSAPAGEPVSPAPAGEPVPASPAGEPVSSAPADEPVSPPRPPSAEDVLRGLLENLP